MARLISTVKVVQAEFTIEEIRAIKEALLEQIDNGNSTDLARELNWSLGVLLTDAGC